MDNWQFFSAQSKHYPLSIVHSPLFGRAGGSKSYSNTAYWPPSGYPFQVLAALRAFHCYPSREKKKEERRKRQESRLNLNPHLFHNIFTILILAAQRSWLLQRSDLDSCFFQHSALFHRRLIVSLINDHFWQDLLHNFRSSAANWP